MSNLRIRPAARAIVLDPDDRILLVRFVFPGGRTFWATPGGGMEVGETTEDAVRRELAEETGLTDVDVGPVVWLRLHIVPFIGGQWDGQHEHYHLVRAPAFTPQPRHTWEQLNAEYVFELRWWRSLSSGRRMDFSLPAASPSSCDRSSATAHRWRRSTPASDEALYDHRCLGHPASLPARLKRASVSFQNPSSRRRSSSSPSGATVYRCLVPSFVPTTRPALACQPRQRLAIGSRQSRPKARGRSLTPGGACRRLYSDRSTSASTRSTVAASNSASSSSRERSSST